MSKINTPAPICLVDFDKGYWFAAIDYENWHYTTYDTSYEIAIDEAYDAVNRKFGVEALIYQHTDNAINRFKEPDPLRR